MQRNIHVVLQEFLQIVKYPNDREKFVKEFNELNHLETLANTLDNFSSDIQEKIKNMVNTEEKIEEIKKHLSTEEYQKEFNKVSHEAIQKYIEVVSPLLTLNQKQKVTKLLHQ